MKKLLTLISVLISISCFSQGIKYNSNQRIISNTSDPAWIQDINAIKTIDSFKIRNNPVNPTAKGSIAQLRASTGLYDNYISTERGKEGIFIYDATDHTSTDNEGTVIVTGEGERLKRAFSGPISINWFGAKGDGVTNNKPYLRLVADYINSIGAGTLTADKGRYMVSHDSSNAIMSLRGLSNITFKFDDAVFFSDDYNDFINISLTHVGTVATATSSVAHGFSVGQLVTIKESTDNVYNTYYTITTVPSPTTFTYNLLATPSGNATAKARLADVDRTLFRFDSCKNIDFGTVKFEGTIQPQYMQARLGYVLTKVNNHCENIKGKLIASGVYTPLKSGEYTLDIGNSSRFDMAIEGHDMGYPFTFYKSGDNSNLVVKAETLHRGGYINGANHLVLNSFIKNYDITGVLVGAAQVGTSQKFGCDDIELNIHDVGTTGRPSQFPQGQISRNMVTIAGYFVDDSSIINNVRINLFGKNVAYLSPVYGATYSTMDTIRNITVSGLIDQRGLDSTHIYGAFDFGSEGASVSGTYSGLKFINYRVLTPPGTPVGSSRLLTRHLDDNIILDNVEANIPIFQSLPSPRIIERRGAIKAGNMIAVDSSTNSVSIKSIGTLNNITRFTADNSIFAGSTINDDTTIVSIVKSVPSGLGANLSLRNINPTSTGSSVSLTFAPTASPTSRYSAISATNDGSNNISMDFITGAGSLITSKLKIWEQGRISTYGPLFTTSPSYFTLKPSAGTVGTALMRWVPGSLYATPEQGSWHYGTNNRIFFVPLNSFKSVLLSDTTTVTNGMIPIGRTSTGDFAVGTLTAGTGINITNGSGSVTVASTNLTGSATLDFPSTAAQTSSELTVTVTGAADGDNVLVSPLNASSNANSCYTARVSASNTVSVKFNNYSAGVIDPASGVFKVTVIK